MAAYRFCRTDDIALLVDALNRCWAPYAPGEPPMAPEAFKRSIRDLQIWCSSCMVAFAGTDPIGVLIGAKRPSGTLIHRIAVHPDHRRLGHGRHLLTSLGSKLAILGPPRIVAEVPESSIETCELFRSCGFVEEAVLTDYVMDDGSDRGGLDGGGVDGDLGGGRFVIPITVDDLAANGLLDGAAHPPTCWEHSVETLMARRDDIAGLAVASDERIEAFLLHVNGEIVSMRCFAEDDGACLRALLARGMKTARWSKVHPSEVSTEIMATLGFRPAGERHLLYAATARSD